MVGLIQESVYVQGKKMLSYEQITTPITVKKKKKKSPVLILFLLFYLISLCVVANCPDAYRIRKPFYDILVNVWI